MRTLLAVVLLALCGCPTFTEASKFSCNVEEDCAQVADFVGVPAGGLTCASGRCCAPDCSGRSCRDDDGCGKACGCPSGQEECVLTAAAGAQCRKICGATCTTADCECPLATKTCVNGTCELKPCGADCPDLQCPCPRSDQLCGLSFGSPVACVPICAVGTACTRDGIQASPLCYCPKCSSNQCRQCLIAGFSCTDPAACCSESCSAGKCQ